MSIYLLDKSKEFPNPFLADKSGILAVGGDLTTERLINAYSNGIFPWYNEDDPIIWWAPIERFVLYPEKTRISRSTKKFIKKSDYKITLNKDFYSVINKCRDIRKNKEGTWINENIIKSYHTLYKLGYAHSVEVWEEENLIGGLYGISLGKIFFGESMFSLKNNASKIALIKLSKYLLNLGYKFIDCQIHSEHLEKLGAETISREQFYSELAENIDLDNPIPKNKDIVLT